MVVALYDCQPDRKDELGFKEGERIVVTRKINNDWWVSSKPHLTKLHTASLSVVLLNCAYTQRVLHNFFEVVI